MGETSATGSSDVVASAPTGPDAEPQMLGFGKVVRTVATPDLDVQLQLYVGTYSPVAIADAGWPSLVTGLPPPVLATVSDPTHQSAAAVDAALTSGSALRSAFDRFSALLASSWSLDTAYPDTVTQSHWKAGSPRGQCGVSSVFLAGVLSRIYSISSTFCHGSVRLEDHEVEQLSDHCWLEIDIRSGDRLILDLTCDQAPGFRQIVFESKAGLTQEHIHYISDERIDISDLAPDDPIWRRYQELLFNMVMVSAFGAWVPHDKR